MLWWLICRVICSKEMIGDILFYFLFLQILGDFNSSILLESLESSLASPIVLPSFMWMSKIFYSIFICFPFFFRLLFRSRFQIVKVPNEIGSLEPLRGYQGEDIEIQLPGNLTVYDIDWLAVWCVEYRHNFGHVYIPKDLDVPPALGQTKIAVIVASLMLYNLQCKIYEHHKIKCSINIFFFFICHANE